MVSGGEESPGILSDDQQPESPTDSNENDETAKNMPWLKAVIDLITSYNYYCTHKGYCHPFCYKRHMRSCTRLIKATRKVNRRQSLQLSQNTLYTLLFYLGLWRGIRLYL